MKKTLVFFYILSVTLAKLSAQTNVQTDNGSPVEILNAEEFINTKTDKGEVKRLIGDVKLRQQDVTMFCDSAIISDDDKQVDAYSRVVINQGDTVHIYGDVLNYNARKRLASLKNNVRMVNGKAVLVTDQLDYDMNTKIGVYNNGATITNADTKMTSDKGYFHNKTRDVYFKHNVKLNNKKFRMTADTLRYNTESKIAYFLGPTNITNDTVHLYCEGGFYSTQTEDALFTTRAHMINKAQSLNGDSIYYFKKLKRTIALGHVFVKDTAQHTRLYAGRAVYTEENNEVVATLKPLLVSDIDKDSILVNADTLFTIMHKDSTRLFSAYHHARLFKRDMQGLADSMTFSTVDSIFHFYKDPVLWIDSNQLKSDTIYVRLKNKKIYSAYMHNKSTIINRSDSGLYNQIAGKTIISYFRNDSLRKINVNGNGEAIYFLKNDSGAYVGVNSMVCSHMIIDIDSNTVKKIHSLAKPEGVFQSVNKADPSKLQVKNFIWLYARRPKSAGEMKR